MHFNTIHKLHLQKYFKKQVRNQNTGSSEQVGGIYQARGLPLGHMVGHLLVQGPAFSGAWHSLVLASSFTSIGNTPPSSARIKEGSYPAVWNEEEVLRV